MVNATDCFARQVGDCVLHREPAGLPCDEMQQLPVKPHRALRAQTMVPREWSLRIFRICRSIAANEFPGTRCCYGENRAGVPTRKGMSVAIRLPRVE